MFLAEGPQVMSHGPLNAGCSMRGQSHPFREREELRDRAGPGALGCSFTVAWALAVFLNSHAERLRLLCCEDALSNSKRSSRTSRDHAWARRDARGAGQGRAADGCDQQHQQVAGLHCGSFTSSSVCGWQPLQAQEDYTRGNFQSWTDSHILSVHHGTNKMMLYTFILA